MDFTPINIFFYPYILIIIICTVDDYICSLKSKHNRYSTIFSLYTNVNGLLSLKVPENSITCIHGLKTLSMIFIVFYHSFQMMFNSIGLSHDPEYQHFKRRALLMTILTTDTFFLVSGFLSVKCFMRKDSKYFNILFQRYMRLIPTAAFLMLLLVSTSKFEGLDGYLRSQEGDCRQFWWTSMLFVQTYYNPDNACVGPLWFMTVCWHIFLITPLLLKFLKFSSRPFRILFMLLVLVGTFVPGYLNSYGALTVMAKYTDTITRSFPYLFGVFYFHEFFKIKEISQVIRYSIWVLAMIVFFLSIHLLFNTTMSTPDITSSFHYIRMVWPLALCWLIHACHNGWGGIINAILSFKYFIPFSNICLGLYIMNDYVGHYIIPIVLNHTNGMKFPNDRIVILFILTYTIASVAAVFLHLFIEVPFAKLATILLDSSIITRNYNNKCQNSSIDYVIFSKKSCEEDKQDV